MFACASFSEQVLAQNPSFKNESHLHEIASVKGTHRHINGFARGIVLTPREKVNSESRLFIHWNLVVFVYSRTTNFERVIFMRPSRRSSS